MCLFYADRITKEIYIPKKKKSSVFKLVKLLSVNNLKELNYLGKYLSSALKMRAQH